MFITELKMARQTEQGICTLLPQSHNPVPIGAQVR